MPRCAWRDGDLRGGIGESESVRRAVDAGHGAARVNSPVNGADTTSRAHRNRAHSPRLPPPSETKKGRPEHGRPPTVERGLRLAPLVSGVASTFSPFATGFSGVQVGLEHGESRSSTPDVENSPRTGTRSW